MASYWIKVSETLTRHRKILILTETLGISEPEAIGHLVLLWLWGAENAAADGTIRGASDLMLANVTGWERDPEELVDGLLTAGFLDRDESGELSIHNWEEYGGKLKVEREKDRQRKSAGKVSAGIPAERSRNSGDRIDKSKSKTKNIYSAQVRARERNNSSFEVEDFFQATANRMMKKLEEEKKGESDEV